MIWCHCDAISTTGKTQNMLLTAYERKEDARPRRLSTQEDTQKFQCLSDITVVRYVSCANSPRLSFQVLSKDAIGMEIQGARLD